MLGIPQDERRNRLLTLPQAFYRGQSDSLKITQVYAEIHNPLMSFLVFIDFPEEYGDLLCRKVMANQHYINMPQD